MVNKQDTKTHVLRQESSLKSRLSSYYASKLEPKIARTFTDDADYQHGARNAVCRRTRPGQRDDEIHCALSTMLTGL